ncbi:MAG: DUF3667 domain-containing protein [Pseudomonadales bacterium]
MTDNGHCPCCGTARETEYCSVCGQNDRDYRRSFLGLVGSFISETFELDGRLVKTLRALFGRPGFLPQEFSENRRAVYVTPARLYFFTSVLFFFILSVGAPAINVDPVDADLPANGTTEVEAEADNGPEKEDEVSVNLNINIDDDDTEANPRVLRALLSETRLRRLDAILANAERKDKIGGIQELAKAANQIEADENSPSWLKEIFGKIVDIIDKPEKLGKTFSENVPLAMFVLLPAYALLLKLLFYRRKPPVYYSEHFVFALYLHVVAFLIFSVDLLIPDDNPISTWLFFVTFAYLGYYTYRAMRTYYGRSRAQTLWRFGVLGAGYLVLFVPAFAFVIVYSFISL